MKTQPELERELLLLEKRFKETRPSESLSESLRVVNLRTRIETIKWVLGR